MKLLSFLFATTPLQMGVADLMRPQQPNHHHNTNTNVNRFTLFIKTRNHDVLDNVLQDAPHYKAPYLTKAQVRELTGLHADDIKTMEAAVVGVGGHLLRVSAHADSVTIEVPRDVSYNDIAIILKTLTSAVSLLKEDDRSGSAENEFSLHDHIALIHQHEDSTAAAARRGEGEKAVGVSSSKSMKKVKGMVDASRARGEQAELEDDNARNRRLQSSCQPGVYGQITDDGVGWSISNPYQTTPQMINYVALALSNQFRVCCPNGEYEGQNNTCASSATLRTTPKYFSTGSESSDGSSSTPPEETVEIEDIQNIRIGTYEGSYIYFLPVAFFKPNVYYQGASVSVNTIDNQVLEQNMNTSFFQESSPIVNIFNATGATIKKDIFGVPEKYQGTADQVQLTSGLPTGGFYYNAQNLSSYLEMQGISDANPLEIVDNWYLPYSTNVAYESGDEPTLDVSALQSIAPKATTKAISGSDSVPDQLEAWNQYFDLLMVQESPGVISWSWSVTSLDSRETILDILYASQRKANSESQLPSDQIWANVIDIAENKLKKLAARGFTILAASGDEGASGNGGGSGGCINYANVDYNHVGQPINHTKYPELSEYALMMNRPDFDKNAAGINVGYLFGNQASVWPQISEWVTSVGGTQLLVLEEGGEATEVACSAETGCGVTSSGGFTGSAPVFETQYKRPSWQDELVQEYLNNNGRETFPHFPDEKYTMGYNPNGRGFPDLAAYANWFPILLNGEFESQAGTSEAAPSTAGLITLVNQALLEQGYAPVAYMNPMLYWMGSNCPEAFNDITFGNNRSPNIFDYLSGGNCKHGYNAAPGWDPVTGLGSIKFEGFVSCAIKYQSNSGKEDSVETMSETVVSECSGSAPCDVTPSGCTGPGCISISKKSQVITLEWIAASFVFAAAFLAM